MKRAQQTLLPFGKKIVRQEEDKRGRKGKEGEWEDQVLPQDTIINVPYTLMWNRQYGPLIYFNHNHNYSILM